MIYLELLIGFALLLAGGEFLVRGAVAVARRLEVSPLLVGIILVGFGTSLPELVASVKAALAGAPGIAIGNVVGSNICNILLILGATAVIYPVACPRGALLRDGSMVVAASVLVIALCYSGWLDRSEGLILVVLVVVYAVGSYLIDRRSQNAARTIHEAEVELVEPLAGSLWTGLAVTAGGIAAVILGAELLVDAAIELAEAFGVDDTVVGLTVVALGTSLPELATGLVAAFRKQSDIALGNVLGSNTFNLLGILGTTALIKPIPIPASLLGFDLWAMLGATLLLFVAAVTGWRINRQEGVLFLALYVGYIVILVSPGLHSALEMH
ncbi:cation:H+ antiporter [Tistlia consotensis]|uniref:Cation:H+ antiporter n=1 Tax=Tistlia consotensis USBA 355 TaxID=560819 RepID=A0A1Y6BB37_9PROT|nr:calcium/sodium antiporter [Tistlia consotensis]SME91461.1 cation:H+ antiporter [Tistlia consotensis USBA 355]SNR27400.1 cation:H+ antiporter [Tistlia consotensis]